MKSLVVTKPVTEPVNEEFLPYPAVNSIGVKPSNVDQRLLLFDVPGQGNKSRVYCGHAIHAIVCRGCKRSHPHDYHCKNFSCPVCYPYASLQGADRAAKKIFGVLEEFREMEINPGYVNHLTISLPDEKLNDFLYVRGKNKGNVNFEKLKDFFYKAAQRIGISGGFLVIHPGRGKDELTGALIEAQKDEGDEHPRTWKGIQSNILELDNWREYVDFGIHAHVTGYFKIPVKEDGTKYTSDDFFRDTGGCTYKNITVDGCKKNGIPVKPENFESLKAIIAYELGHHAYRKGKHGITQFGVLRGWKEVKVGADYIYEKCDECGSELVQISRAEYENFLADNDSVDLRQKKKVLRSKPIIRYLLNGKYREEYSRVFQSEVAQDEEKIKVFLENKRKGLIDGGPPKKPVRKFVPYHVEEDYVSLRVACRYKLNIR